MNGVSQQYLLSESENYVTNTEDFNLIFIIEFDTYIDFNELLGYWDKATFDLFFKINTKQCGKKECRLVNLASILHT